MADYREEAYILDKVEVSDDELDDQFPYEEIKETLEPDVSKGELDLPEDDDDEDLNDFEALKAKTTMKRLQQATKSGADTSLTAYKPEAKPKVLEKDVVIDDFIRNFLQRFSMGKTLNVFQQEWFELQKKGTFHDTHIGLITDIENKNKRLRDQVVKMKSELADA